MPVIASLLPPEDAQALIFDCDGTLADTFAAHYRTFRQALSVYGVDFRPDFYAARVGSNTVDLLKSVTEETGVLLDAAAITADNTDGFMQHLGAIRSIAPVEAIVRHYHGRLPLGVASSGHRPMVTATLEATGLYDLFDTIVTFEDAPRAKPAPDLYLKACENLKVAPQQAHAYEDSDTGITAARAAGLSVTDIRPYYAPDPSVWPLQG